MNDRISVRKNDLQVFITMFGNFDLEKLFARSSEFRQLSMSRNLLLQYNAFIHVVLLQ